MTRSAMSFAAFVSKPVANGFSVKDPRMVRVSTVPGEWEWMLECPACDGAGVTDVEVAVPDPIRGGYLSEELGECPLCEGRQYVELEDDGQ